MLLSPRRIVPHLRISGVLLQFCDLLGDIAVTLGMKVDGESETTEQRYNSDSRCFCHCMVLPESGWNSTPRGPIVHTVLRALLRSDGHNRGGCL